jgi:hypothetical protein
MSTARILGIVLAALTFLCFFLAGLFESDFAMWVDGAGVSLIIYGLVYAGGWLISGLRLAEEVSGIPEPSTQQIAPASNLWERIKQLSRRLARPTPPA